MCVFYGVNMLILSGLLLRLDSWFPMNEKEVFLSFFKNEIQISQGGINKMKWGLGKTLQPISCLVIYMNFEGPKVHIWL